MSTVDPYDDRRHRSHRHREDDRQPRYVETQETYVRAPASAPAVPEPPYNARTTEIIRRPVREDSDLSIEEVRRDFPPPGSHLSPRSGRDERYGSARSRSAERGYYDDPRRSYNELDDRRSRKTTIYAEEEVRPRRRSLSRNQKIIAGVAGAALAVGGKELWDRRQADGRPVSRNALQTAAVGAAGAFAGYGATEVYAKHGAKAQEKVKTYVAHQGRDGKVEDAYYSSDEDYAPPKRSKSRRKSLMEGAMGLAGLGAAAKATGGRDHDSRDGRSRGRSPEGAAKFQQAAKAALLAGATEAFRVRKEPGGWGGDKGKRILTAAIGAGGIDAAADRDPENKSKRHILEAVVGGLAGNRLINGSRKDIEDDGRGSRSRSRGARSRSRGARSRSRGPEGGGGGAGLAALATAGLGALAGKKLLDRSRSRSRGPDRDRRRRYSSDSYDSRSPSPRRGSGKDRHKRSKSVTDYARNGLAALGIGAAAGGHDRDRGDSREVVEETRIRKSRRGGSDDGYGSRRSRNGDSTQDLGYSRDRGDPRDRGDLYGDPRYADSRSSVGGSRAGGGRQSAREKDGKKNKRIAEGKQPISDSDSDLGSSTDDEKRAKKMKAPRY